MPIPTFPASKSEIAKEAAMSSSHSIRETTPPDGVPAVSVVPMMATVIEEEITDGNRLLSDGSVEVDDGMGNEDELDLFPGGLELPPLRSPRGSLHSLYGSNCSSRKNSNCSIGSNARSRCSLALSLSRIQFSGSKFNTFRVT